MKKLLALAGVAAAMAFTHEAFATTYVISFNEDWTAVTFVDDTQITRNGRMSNIWITQYLNGKNAVDIGKKIRTLVQFDCEEKTKLTLSLKAFNGSGDMVLSSEKIDEKPSFIDPETQMSDVLLFACGSPEDRLGWSGKYFFPLPVGTNLQELSDQAYARASKR